MGKKQVGIYSSCIRVKNRAFCDEQRRARLRVCGWKSGFISGTRSRGNSVKTTGKEELTTNMKKNSQSRVPVQLVRTSKK